MSTETDSGTSTDGTSTTGECDGCDVGALACSIEMYTRQSEVAKDSTEALEGYQEKFDSARGKYTKARADAEADVKAAKTMLKECKTSLECEFRKEKLGNEKLECLRKSLDKVTAAITECAGTSGGCCVGDCSYPSAPTEGETTSSLAGLIDQYRQAAERNKACFDSVIKVLDSIPTDVTNLKTNAKELHDDVKKDGPKDLVRLYARYLVLWSQLNGDKLFGGFASVNAYVDCLCKALQCSYAAWQALIEVEGRKAKLECEEKARKAECDRKQKDILEDIMCEYEKCKPSEPPSGCGHDPDCGCEHNDHGSGQTAS